MPGRIEKTIFISYRRTNSFMARAVYQSLTTKGYDVFFDYEGVNSGDFEQIILGNLRARAHFLVILTPSALERCNEPGDWLRREIEAAIDEKRNIVPLFFEGFNFGSPSISQYLIGKMAKLKNYNGLNVPSDYFDEAMNKLVNRYLNIPLDAVIHPLSSQAKRGADIQKAAVRKTAKVTEKEISAEEWFEKGYKYGEAKNYDEAIQCYTEAIRLKPDYAEPYNNRGLARADKGDLTGAIKDYTRSIELNNPELHLPYNNRGAARYDQGDFAAAIKDYNEAIRLKPDYADAYLNRGLVRNDQGDFAAAIKDYNEAIRLKPDYAEAYNNRGIVRKAQGDLTGAIKDSTRSIELNNPELHLPYNNRGAAHDDQGDFAAAIKDYNEAIRLQPDHADAYYNRALVWEKKEDYRKAIADYQKYLELGGGSRDGDQKEVEGFIRALKKKIK
jgi:tetratricopeptide (TPR) repeat protein